MAFVLFQIALISFLLSICLPFILSLNTTKIQCNYDKYGSNGCPKDSHMVCNNQTNYCLCNKSGDHRISFGDTECLPNRRIDEKCIVSEQCSRDPKDQLICVYTDPVKSKLIKLDEEVSKQFRQRLNKTIEGFCRCDDNYYYDYEENQCLSQNSDNNFSPFFEDFFCKQCPLIDDNSYCDHKTQTCVCKQGFKKNSEGRCVQIRLLFENCGNFDECVVSDSYCEPIVGQCICNDGYYPDKRKRHCIRGRNIFDNCAEHRECSYLFGYCDPKDWRCFCDPKESVQINRQCVKRTAYGQLCSHLSPDMICELSTAHTICSKYTNRCVCEDGYLFMSNECQKININRFAFGDDFRQIDDNRNPMTYIVIIFCTVFGLTILASIMIKLFRRPFIRPSVALYESNPTSSRTSNPSNHPLSRSPSAPPAYSESPQRERYGRYTHTMASNHSDNEDKPPTYEEAISGCYTVD